MEFVVEVFVEIIDIDLSFYVVCLKDVEVDVVLFWIFLCQGVIIVINVKVINFELQYIVFFIFFDMGLMYNFIKGVWEGVIFGLFVILFYQYDDLIIVKYKFVFVKYYLED